MPVKKAASGLAKNKAAAATSLGNEKRPKGMDPKNLARFSGV